MKKIQGYIKLKMLIRGSEMRLSKSNEPKKDSAPVCPRKGTKRGNFMKNSFVNIFYMLEVGQILLVYL